jgi:hypothetical protein
MMSFSLPRPRSRPSCSFRFGKERRGRTRTIVAVTLLIIAGATSFGQEPVAKARAHFEIKGEPLVGQRLTLVVDLLAPGFFAGNPSYNLPDVPGVLLIPPSESPVIGTVQENGLSYTSQRHELYVFARRPGQFVIPPVAIRLQFKRNPLDNEPVVQTVQTPALSFTVKAPPGAENLSGIISARDLKIEETWKPEPGKAKAGDAFTRTVTFTAPDVPAMAFPEFPAEKIDGLGIYPKTPEVLDKSDRGTLLGERRDTITYVCQRPGQFVIPAAQMTWFDLDAQQLRTIDFPARTIEVAPNPALPIASTVETTHPHLALKWLGAGAALLILLSAVVVWRQQLYSLLLRGLAPWRPIHLQPLNPTS